MGARTITAGERLQLIGLLTLAQRQNREIREEERAIAALLSEADEGYGYFGHVSDAVWGFEDGDAVVSADGLLRMLDIRVAE